jgi:hypothetical protein
MLCVNVQMDVSDRDMVCMEYLRVREWSIFIRNGLCVCVNVQMDVSDRDMVCMEYLRVREWSIFTRNGLFVCECSDGCF